MPNYWLLKTEPNTYSYDDLVRDGKTTWDGVTNALALKHLRSMSRGDLVFIYHTGDEKQIVGLAEVTSNPYRDPKYKDEKLAVIDINPRERLNRPVTLSEIKADRGFAQFELVRMSRLSVMPVVERHRQRIILLANRTT